jgi:hypothetical protein
MDSVLNTLFIKRFCLPSNVNINDYENGNERIVDSCICGNYNHISCILSASNDCIKCIGINHMGNANGNIPGIHAEHCVLKKLKPLKNKKKLVPINLLVVRLSKMNKLQSSKPCYHCIQYMKTIPLLKGYKLQYIYYSNETNKLTKTKLKDLEQDNYHYSRYYKNKYQINHSNI